MPIYEYICRSGHHFEVIEGFDAPPSRKCETCGKKAERKISLAAFHLKGSGWYCKDVTSSNGKAVGEKDKPAESTAEKSSGESSGDSAAPAKAETKPAKKEKKPAKKSAAN